jgi:predicted cupin superfamily sugar epimerase
MNTDRVDELIQSLELKAHPEGGYYSETWRSPLRVAPSDDRGSRSALTTIYFLLPAGAVSRLHRVRSDEIWIHIEGAALELLRIPPDEWRLDRITLGTLAEGHAPVECVPANWWQAARSTGEYSLVSCAVGPGFEFGDFEMMSEKPGIIDELRREIPGCESLV